jgi:FkbM family methyltransferase
VSDSLQKSSVVGRSLHAVLRRVPQPVLNRVGGWELRHATVRRLVRWAVRPMQASDTIIGEGVGAGLLFNSSGGFPSRALGYVEPEVQKVLAELLGPGDVFYDVGANIGYFTVIGARLVGPAGRVVAVEPQPEAVRRLQHNVAINGFDNVTVVEAAVDNEEGEGDLMVSHEGILEWAALEHSPAPEVPSIRVRVTTLDRIRADQPAPKLVKLDVEGAESRALVGMRELLRRDKPPIVCEVHASLQELRAQLEAEGYDVARLGAQDGGDYCQVLATPR